MARTVDPRKFLQTKTVHDCVPVGAAHPRLQILQKTAGKILCGEVSVFFSELKILDGLT